MRETPLYTGLTRPAMMLGLPVLYCVLTLGFAAALFMVLPWKFAFVASAGIWGVFRLLTEFEPNFGWILWVVLRRTPPQPLDPRRRYFGV